MYKHDLDWVLEAARSSAKDRSTEWAIDEIRWAHGCVEPGYPDQPVMMANWNETSAWDGDKRIVHDRVMPRLFDILEKLGYSCEWSDEWGTCGDCGKAFRIQPDSYSWRPSFIMMNDCELVCCECIENDPEYYIGKAAEDGKPWNVYGIDPEDHGWIEAFDGSGGLYRHNDGPEFEARVRELRDLIGEEHVLVHITGVGQFEARARCMVPEDAELGLTGSMLLAVAQICV